LSIREIQVSFPGVRRIVLRARPKVTVRTKIVPRATVVVATKQTKVNNHIALRFLKVVKKRIIDPYTLGEAIELIKARSPLP